MALHSCHSLCNPGSARFPCFAHHPPAKLFGSSRVKIHNLRFRASSKRSSASTVPANEAGVAAERTLSPPSTSSSSSISTSTSVPDISSILQKTKDHAILELDDDAHAKLKFPGEEPDFWEGPKWDNVGFIMEYFWAVGIFFALIACAVAVRTYNEGATDFKETAVYKEAIEARGLFDEPTETEETQIPITVPDEEAPNP